MMTRLRAPGALLAIAMAASAIAVPATTLAAPTTGATMAKVRLTGLNRASRVVAVSQAAMLNVATDMSFLYQGSPLYVPRGTYLIAAEVPTYSGTTLTSQTLVFRKATIGRSETIRLDGRYGRRLRVSLTGAQAAAGQLMAGVCMSNSPGGQGQLEGDASAGPGVAIYAVPVRSRYITFSYSDILTSAAGATYFLTGFKRGEIPARLSYAQRASGLAKLTMALRSGAYGSSEFSWEIQSGTSQSFCGEGQTGDVFSMQRWVTYRTPGRWTTDVTAFSQGRVSASYRNAYFFTNGRYRAGTSHTNTFGGAVAGPGLSVPQTSADYRSTSNPALLSYSPGLFESPDMSGGSICCDHSVLSLRLGGRVIKTARVGNDDFFLASIRRAGWYTLDDSDSRSFQNGPTPADLLSPRVTVSFRFHASPIPAGNGAGQNLPLTDARYVALGLNIANQAPAGGLTKLNIRIMRPPNAGVPSPVYRLKVVKVYASFNSGASWQLLTLHRLGSGWQARIRDPASGFVSIRSIVTDVHGDRTEQTVYRAYAIAG